MNSKQATMSLGASGTCQQPEVHVLGPRRSAQASISPYADHAPAEGETCVMLATEDEDLGLVPSDAASAIAKAYSAELGATVYLRDPVSDHVINVIPHRKSARGL